MVNRRRSRELTHPDRPITRSITRQAEEHARQKPRLSDFGHEDNTTPPSKTHRGNTHDALSHKFRGLSIYTMAFSYPRFNGETYAATNVRLFLNLWNANHMAQRLPEEEAHQSKMTEFGLTLDGRAAFWHSQMDLPTIKTFDALQSTFLRFFHKKVPQHVIIGQFYTIKQLPFESIVDFSLRFQNLR